MTNFRSTVPLLASFALVSTAAAFECEGVQPVPGEDITFDLVSASLSRPIDVQAPPGDTDRLFVVEQGGTIRIIRLADDSVATTPFLNIASRVISGGEQGLLGLAFHPRYAENGYFYVNYTRRSDGGSVIARYSRSVSDPDTADPASELFVITYAQPFANHNAGQLAFGPNDGYLYVSTGDGGSGGDPQNNSQNANALLGKMLRLNVDGDDFPTDTLRSYRIPPTNPFTAAGDGIRDEIWSTGLRNPWRFAFDPLNGDLYIGDVGQNLWEEVDYTPGTSAGGENYEWRVREGLHNFNAGTAYGPGARTSPIYEYPHGSGLFRGCSITGGVVYRGCRMPNLHGAYFFADYCNDWIGTFRVAGGRMTELRDRTAELNLGISPDRADEIACFGVDGRGEVYVSDLDTRLFRIVPRGFTDRPPTARIATVPSPAVVELADGMTSATLDARSSDDGNGGSQGLTYAWTKVSGPAGDMLETPSAARTVVRFTQAGDYGFSLEVNDGVGSDAAEVAVTVNEEPPPQILRGDANADLVVDISDGITTLLWLFAASTTPTCLDSCDTNDDGMIDLADPVYTFNFLFRGGESPPSPGAIECGPDSPEADSLNCALYPSCV